jgi:hypothetical protein
MCCWIIRDRTKKLEATRQGSGVLLVYPSVSVKDRSLLIPLVMLNTCLIFSWPNKVPFDRESSNMIRAGIYTSARIGVAGGMTGTRRVSPRCVLTVGRFLGTTAPVCPAAST